MPNGSTFDYQRDGKRLGKQLKAVLSVVESGDWHTFQSIQKEILDTWGLYVPEASISARLRDLRNEHGCIVEREFVTNGLHRYRVIVPKGQLSLV